MIHFNIPPYIGTEIDYIKIGILRHCKWRDYTYKCGT